MALCDAYNIAVLDEPTKYLALTRPFTASRPIIANAYHDGNLYYAKKPANLTIPYPAAKTVASCNTLISEILINSMSFWPKRNKYCALSV